jgi:hypothetical protein
LNATADPLPAVGAESSLKGRMRLGRSFGKHDTPYRVGKIHD